MSQQTIKAYPRSVPFNPPPKSAPRKSRLWPWALASVASVIAVGAITAIVLNKDLLPTRGMGHAQAAPADNAIPVVTPVSLSAAPQQTSVAMTEAPDERVLSALGGLSAAHLYQTYLNIGMLADSVENEVYSPEEGLKLLDTVSAMIATVDAQMARLSSTNIKAEDKQALEQTRQLVALLRVQTTELRAYWQTGEKSHATKFQQTRETAWTGIKDLLGIKE